MRMTTDAVKYWYKKSKVNNEDYIQVWSRHQGHSRYVGTIGNAAKAYKLLVRLKELEALTKSLKEKVTKLASVDMP